MQLFKTKKPKEETRFSSTASNNGEESVRVKEMTLNKLFTRCHINIIQPRYVPNISAALDISKLILNSCGDDWTSISPFYRSASENYLAAVIWLFVNFRPTGYKGGVPLKHMLHYNRNTGIGSLSEDDLEFSYKGWSDFIACDSMGNEVLDFTNNNGENLSMKDDGQLSSLNDMSYMDKEGGFVTVTKNWYINFKGVTVEPDSVMGQYSDLGHVIDFIFSSYDEMFSVISKCDPQIKALTLPFISAYENKAMDQLEGMMGTLRVVLSRLVSPLAFFLFTSGDDIDLTDVEDNATYRLIITSDRYEGSATESILHVYGNLARKYGWDVKFQYTKRDKSLETQPILFKNFNRVRNDIELLFSSLRASSSEARERQSAKTLPPVSSSEEESNELDEIYLNSGNKKK